MSEKHTPGPWVSSKFGFQVLTGDSWSTICTLKGDACWEDNRGDYQQEYEWQRQEANARLIAAAPDLLDALKTFVRDYVEMVNSGDCGKWDPETEIKVKDARAAIAKATGEP